MRARVDLQLVRHQIAQTGRYYDAHRTIVVRSGLLLEEERRVLWHELEHADRRDRACDTDERIERIVDRHAAENAMPWCSIRDAWERSTDMDELADLLKLPVEWVHHRILSLHPARKAQLRIRT